MSRTRHLTVHDVDRRDVQTRDTTRTAVGLARPRQRARTRLTQIPGKFYCQILTPVEASGNAWLGTIAQVGGSQRRRDQRDHAQGKVLGRRRNRRRRARDLARQEEA